MLERLKRRLELAGNDRDALLGDLLEEAEQYILGYTGRRVLPMALEGAVIETAAASFRLLGLEGAASHAEGGCERRDRPAARADEGAAGHVPAGEGAVMLCRRWQREVIIRPPDLGRGGNAFQPEGQAVAACVQPLRGALARQIYGQEPEQMRLMLCGLCAHPSAGTAYAWTCRRTRTRTFAWCGRRVGRGTGRRI